LTATSAATRNTNALRASRVEPCADIARSDFDFYVEAGQMQGPVSDLKIEDFWHLAPLERARKALGG
jgi:hypothetical protein